LTRRFHTMNEFHTDVQRPDTATITW